MGDDALPWTGVNGFAHGIDDLPYGEKETEVPCLSFVQNCAQAEVITLFERWGGFTPSSIEEWSEADYKTETYALRYFSDIAAPLVCACAISHRKVVRRGSRWTGPSKEETIIQVPLFVTHRAWRRLSLGQYLVQLILDVLNRRQIESILVPSVQNALSFWRSSAVNAEEVPENSANETLHELSYKHCTLLKLSTRLRNKSDARYRPAPDPRNLFERKIIGSLLDGARYGSVDLFHRAYRDARDEDVRYVYQGNQGLLFDVVQRPNTEEALLITQTLLPRVDVNQKDTLGQTPIFYCCNLDNRVELVKLLIRAQADPRIADNNGQTCLFYACKSGNLNTVTALINMGLSINSFDNTEKRPLYYALLNKHYTLLEPLLPKKGLSHGECLLTADERALIEKSIIRENVVPGKNKGGKAGRQSFDIKR